MYELYAEQRLINGKNLLSWDLAHHLYMRSVRDKVIVVAEKPVDLVAATRKQWLKLMRQVIRQRASTLNSVRSLELTEQISYMQNLQFSTKQPQDYLEANVTFATTDDFLKWSPECRTMYITYPVELETVHRLTAWMPRYSLIVMYKQ